MGLWTLLAFESWWNTFKVLRRMTSRPSFWRGLKGPWWPGNGFSCMEMTVPGGVWVGKVVHRVRCEVCLPSPQSISQVHSRWPSGWFCLVYACRDS